ncbi:G-protein coupled receptor GRL101-like, partial [Mercenaria mercenaria]|uniref:G-protein coupled receptor GRL101-like n=1 Tax=Mercenaria mercenaria TaxID=6596 RepID=UPI00234EC187
TMTCAPLPNIHVTMDNALRMNNAVMPVFRASEKSILTSYFSITDTCQSDVAFHCDILRCIPKRLKCDNYVDCEDGSDEDFCRKEVYSSCREWWNAGYRRNGKYITEDITVQCNFDDFQDNDIAYTIFDALDMVGKLRGIVGRRNLEKGDDVIYLSDRYDCVQQIKKICEYSKLNTALTDQCGCNIYTFDPAYSMHGTSYDLRPTVYNENCTDVLVDNRSVTRYFGPPHNEVTLDSFRTKEAYRLIGCSRDVCRMIQIGPAICTDSKADRNSSYKDELPCAQNGQTFPVTQKCKYDIDNAGFPLGCRDGSHLANCEKFECPNDTVKCPGSFCLPIRFVCDGDINCKGGQDEENCGCESLQNEILILYEKGTTEELFIRQFSRQFYTATNIVRVLSFEASKPLTTFDIDSTQILVSDRQIDQRGDTTRVPTCSYKVMSKDFVKSVKFSKNGTRGLIYIQNSQSSKEVADEMFSNITGLTGDYKIYLVTQVFNTDYDNQSFVPKVIPVRVRRLKILTAIGAEYFSALCKVNSKVHCQGQYKCASSKTCIQLDQVCDGYKHCLHGDDELLCDFECPNGCFCNGLAAICIDRNLSHVNDIPKTTRELDLSLNIKLDSVLQQPVLDFIVLSILNVSGCGIKVITRNAFNRLRNLQLLDISYNLIRILPDRVFSSLKQLKTLHIQGNYYLSRIDPNAFQNLFFIRELNLANSLLTKISANTFAGLKLKNIDLSNNKLEDIQPFAFNNLSANIINFEGNTIESLNKDIFTGVIDLKLLRTPSFKFCCIRPNYVDENNCIPTRDEFSSCEDLMRHSVLQFLLWLVGMLALLGNCLSLIYRLKVDRKRLQLSFGIFVTNLAAADLLMGVYLLIIAIADAVFRKRYIYEDEKWRGSFLCNLAGVLSTISSESSVFFLCLITLDRLLVIKFPFRPKFFTKKKSILCVSLAWLTSCFIAILPVVYVGFFQNKFYSRSGVCIALPLTRDRPPGWVYSILVFVLFNFITFLLVAAGQWTIFYEMRKSRGMATAPQSSRMRDLKVARNLLLVVATDFMCWFPIGVMGVTALSGHAISGDVYAWAAVFILPVNSALNPILYTLTAIIGEKV